MRNAYFRLLDAVAPPLTIRRQFLALTRQVPGVLFSYGPVAVVQRTRRAFDRYRRTGALIIPNPITTLPSPQPEPYTYAQWIEANEPDPAVLDNQREQLSLLFYHPLISIIMPIYNPPAGALTAAIESVTAQTYPHWQLCLADGASTDTQIAEILSDYADDTRIVVTRLERNLGISGNSNAALALAQGEFVALLDHDDTLAPNMLFEVATVLNRHPETDIVYFDEDKLSADGAVRDYPWFKPDFSPDLMLSANLLMHGVYRRSLMYEVGEFDPETDGAQDWDLALRCTRRTNAIYHIPKLLYHWRQVPGSASLEPDAKPWAFDAQIRTLERHLEETDGKRPRVDLPSLGRTRVIWPESEARVSIIIPTRDKCDLLQTCLDSIYTQTDYADYEIVLVDTGSTEEYTHTYYEELRGQHSNVNIVDLPGPFNYSHANNVGANAASGELLLFLNNDTVVLQRDWLQELAGWASRPGVGVVGAKLLRPNGLIQHAGIIIGMAGHANHVFGDTPEETFGIFGSTEWYRTYHAVTGACMMIPAKVFDQLGGFDEVYQVAYSDVEFCLRADEAGYRTVFTPFVRLIHDEGSSHGLYAPSSDVLRATCQMLPIIREGDRNFNPCLSLRFRDPALTRPNEPDPVQALDEIMRTYVLLPPYKSGITPPFEDMDLALPARWPDTKTVKTTSLLDSLSILLVTGDLNHPGHLPSIAALAREVATHGANLTLISSLDGPLREDLEAAGVKVQIESSSLAPSQATSAPYLDVGALTRAMDTHDLVIAIGEGAALAMITATAFDRPSIFWLRELQSADVDALENTNIRAAQRSAKRTVYGDDPISMSRESWIDMIMEMTNIDPMRETELQQ